MLMREALSSIGWTVTGTAGSVPAAEELLLRTEPDVAVVDLHLASGGGGHALIGRLRAAGARTRIVVFTASEDPAELRAAFKAGADGIVLKEGGLPELGAGLREVAAGGRFLSPSLQVLQAA
jgi:DNA-binding NarL/FixJ family response regulator